MSWLGQLTNLIGNLHALSTQQPASQRPQLVFYDLGLTADQRSYVQRLTRSHPGYLTSARDFNWDRYPDFWRMKNADGSVRPEHGQYSWKVRLTILSFTR